jgi:uncharacterized protein YhaN
MRLDRLDLIAYGRFTGCSLDLQASARMHLIHGPNEAGKSTMLNAVLDFLFGFHHKTPYNFLHQSPLVGGTVSSRDGSTLSCIRRKGRDRTLLATDGKTPIGEDALAPFLNVGRDDFLRFYALDHAGLRAGGSAMLDRDSDVGRKLFAAGTGLGDLYRIEKEIDAAIEAIGDFVGRGKATQKYVTARRDWQSAQTGLRGATLRASDLKAADRDVMQFEAELAERRARVVLLAENVRGLERMLRVRPVLAELQTLRDEFDALGKGPDLPETLAEVWRTAVTEERQAVLEEERLRGELANAVAGRDATPGQGIYSAMADEIGRLVQGLGTYPDRRAALPSRTRDKENAVAAIVRALAELGITVPPDTVDDIRPSKIDVARARTLATTAVTVANELETARTQLHVDRSSAALTLNELDMQPPSADLGAIRALIDEVVASGDTAAKLEKAVASVLQARDAVTVAFTRLGRWSGPIAELADLPLPTAEEILKFDEGFSSNRQQVQIYRERRREAETSRAEVEAELAILQEAGTVPSAEAVASARAVRDRGIGLLVGEHRGHPDTERMVGYADSGDFAASCSKHHRRRLDLLTA